jgi:hypothetical protein
MDYFSAELYEAGEYKFRKRVLRSINALSSIEDGMEISLFDMNFFKVFLNSSLSFWRCILSKERIKCNIFSISK